MPAEGAEKVGGEWGRRRVLARAVLRWSEGVHAALARGKARGRVLAPLLLLPFFCFGQIKSNETPRVTYYLFLIIRQEIGRVGAARAALTAERPRHPAPRIPRAPPRKIKSNETSLAQMRRKTPFWLFLAPARAKVGGTPSRWFDPVEVRFDPVEVVRPRRGKKKSTLPLGFLYVN